MGEAILKYWPIIVTTIGGLTLVVASLRYRIPDLVKRVEDMEGTDHPSAQDIEELARRIEAIENAERPSKTDIEKAITSFHNICKFNQVSCQKGTSSELAKVRHDIDDKLGKLYDLVNKQAVIIARVDERVAAIHGNTPKSS